MVLLLQYQLKMEDAPILRLLDSIITEGLVSGTSDIHLEPGTEYDRLGSAYKGFDYKILSKDNSEWVKIEYDNKPAYVFAEYVEIVPMFLNDMGEYEEYAEMDSAADKSDKISSEDESQDEETSDEEGTTEEN